MCIVLLGRGTKRRLSSDKLLGCDGLQWSQPHIDRLRHASDSPDPRLMYVDTQLEAERVATSGII